MEPEFTINNPKPRSEAQIEASRRNGALSKGPVSAEGKLHSSMNALRHGLVAKVAIRDGESEEAFHRLLDSLEEIFSPDDSYEISLIETMALAKWRFLRLLGIENAGHRRHIPPNAEDHAASSFAAFENLSKHSTMAMLSRCESRFDRQYARAVQMLQQHRDRKKDKSAITNLGN